MKTENKKRIGPGRKPLPPDKRKKAYATKLPNDVIEYLRQCDNAAVTIEKALRRSSDFRKWNK
jgi:hypothetical protein